MPRHLPTHRLANHGGIAQVWREIGHGAAVLLNTVLAFGAAKRAIRNNLGRDNALIAQGCEFLSKRGLFEACRELNGALHCVASGAALRQSALTSHKYP